MGDPQMSSRAQKSSSAPPPIEGRFPHPRHDHTRCADAALRTAEEICAKSGARLTEIRRQVLMAVWASHAPIGAYNILARLNADRGKTAPMAVYRALDFLMEHGLVHRLASLNAYVGCAWAKERHAAQFFICRACKSAVELDGSAVTRALKKTLTAHGLVSETEIIEVQGLCAHCSRT